MLLALGKFSSRFYAFIFIFSLQILGFYRDEIRHVSSRIAGIYRDEIRYFGMEIIFGLGNFWVCEGTFSPHAARAVI